MFQNDEMAFQQLFDRYWPKVYAVSRKYLKDHETCLEITHDIFLNIWRKRHQLQIGNFNNYVITAASYHSIRRKQSLKSAPITYIEDYEFIYSEKNSVSVQSEINEAETKIDMAELTSRIDDLLFDLPKRCREIYVMSRQEQLPISEIAKRLNISKRTVENQLTSALKHLRTSLKSLIIVVSFYELLK